LDVFVLVNAVSNSRNFSPRGVRILLLKHRVVNSSIYACVYLITNIWIVSYNNTIVLSEIGIFIAKTTSLATIINNLFRLSYMVLRL